MLLTGTTSVVDHLWMTPPNLQSLDASMRAYRANSGSARRSRQLVIDHDYTGDLATDYGVDLSGALFTGLAGITPVAEQQAQLEDFIREWQSAGKTDRLRVFAGPCGAQWCTDELISALADTAERYETCVHLHLLESPLQVPICRKKFGVGAVQGLDRLGVLGPRTSSATRDRSRRRGHRTARRAPGRRRPNPRRTCVPAAAAPRLRALKAGARVALGAEVQLRPTTRSSGRSSNSPR